MASKKKQKKIIERERKRQIFPPKVKQYIWGVVIFLLAIITTLSFFELAGSGGGVLKNIFMFLLGRTVFALPLVFLLGGLMFFSSRYQNKVLAPVAMSLLALSAAGILECLNSGAKDGGWLGYLIAWPLLRGFGLWVSMIIFGALAIVGAIMVFQFLKQERRPFVLEEKEEEAETEPEQSTTEGQGPSLLARIFSPKFKIKEVEPSAKEQKSKKTALAGEIDAKTEKIKMAGYQPPPLDLLEPDREVPASGDIKSNTATIKRTLENFDIPVEMAEVNVGPTVTQYTMKPAEGIKLSRITALSNNLSLALSAHPLRMEAPIPGRPLVGVEVPNKKRATVRMRNMLSDLSYKNDSFNLPLALGRDVSGQPVVVDLAKMPHMLVAGSTGSGKTICLNTLIMSLLYKHSPELLRLILVDPKRVEFPVYNDLPHLLCPVIFGPQKTINALKWLTEEMERRFDVLSANKARDIGSYNAKPGEEGLLPYIVVVIDELADLMAARGKEIEAGIVRLAQMARAVGIHLVVATQRPSVEVITGLIKANITSRVTFLVASQIDSRTVLDVSGAEKLLGQGDMLFVSAENQKPKRIQGVYISEKEIRKVVGYIKSKTIGAILEDEEVSPEMPDGGMTQSLGKALEGSASMLGGISEDAYGSDDSLYEEAKKLVIESGKASASLLQRRLRLGYARAARLIDVLEERGVVGPADGAKPREVYFSEGPREGKTDLDNDIDIEAPQAQLTKENTKPEDSDPGEDEEESASKKDGQDGFEQVIF